LQIVGWTLTKEQQLEKLNLGIEEKLHMVKVNSQLQPNKILKLGGIYLHGHTKI
jgi:hypothetical protein